MTKRRKVRVEHNPQGYVYRENEYRAGEPRLCSAYDFNNPRHVCQKKVRWLVEKRDRYTVGRSYLCDDHLSDELFELWSETLEVAAVKATDGSENDG